MIANGLIRGRMAYLRSAWNQFELAVVVVGIVTRSLSSVNTSIFLAFRIFRAVKSRFFVTQLSRLVNAALISVPFLLDVGLFFIYFLIVACIFGVTILAGHFHYHCYDPATANYDPQVVCAFRDNASLWAYHCPWSTVCTNADPVTQELFPNPDYALGFDHVFMSLFTLFVATSLSGWTQVMYWTLDTTYVGVVLFWIAVVVVGNFFLLNLILIIVAKSYQKAMSMTNEEDAEVKQSKSAAFALDIKLRFTRQLRQFDRDREREHQLAMVTSGGYNQFDTPPATPRDTPTNQATEQRGRRNRTATFNRPLRAAPPPPPSTSLFLERMKRFKINVAPEQQRWISTAFNIGTMILIVLNTAVLALEHAGQPEELGRFISGCRIAVGVYFFLEMSIKFVVLGPRKFVDAWWRVAEGIIALASFISIFVPSSRANFTVLRTTRLIRVFRIFSVAKGFEGLNEMLEAVMRAIPEASILALAMAFVLFIYTVLGMELFAGRLPVTQCPSILQTLDGATFCVNPIPGAQPWLNATGTLFGYSFEQLTIQPREAFDHFGRAFVTVFQVVTGENWDTVMRRAAAQTPAAVPFFLSLYIGSNYIILNLFVAIVLRNIEDFEVESTHHETDLTKMISALGAGEDQSQLYGEPELSNKSFLFDEAVEQRSLMQRLRSRVRFVIRHKYVRFSTAVLILVSCGDLIFEGAREAPDTRAMRITAAINTVLTIIFLIEALLKMFAFGMFVEHELHAEDLHRISALTKALAYKGGFRRFLPPTFRNEEEKEAEQEGLDQRERAYFRDPYNVLDFLVVVTSFVSLFVPKSHFLKLPRCLRPIRFIQSSHGLLVVVHTLRLSLVPLFYVVSVALLFFTVFAILGVEQYKGAFGQCVFPSPMPDPQGSPNVTFPMTKHLCEKFTNLTVVGPQLTNASVTQLFFEMRWTEYPATFNHFPIALLTLFEVMFIEGWTAVLNKAIDHNGEYNQPIFDYSLSRAVFFVLFILTASFFLQNLFLSVLVSNYYRILNRSGTFMLSPEQKEWVQMMKLTLSARPPKIRRPTNPSAIRIYDFVMSLKFETYVAITILLNTAVLCIDHYQYPETATWEILEWWANWPFILSLIVEIGLKMYAFGPKAYFVDDAWNLYDTVTLLSSLFALFFDHHGALSVIARMVRVLRIFRCVRFIKNNTGLRELLQTLWLSVPSFVNILGLMVIVFFIYAIIGNRLYFSLAYGTYITRFTNFERFTNAALSLFRIVTGEGWSSIMHDTMRQPPECNYHTRSCAPVWLGPLYFISFYILGRLVLLHLFIGVILQNFTDVMNDFGKLCKNDILRFALIWTRLDPSLTYMLPPSRFQDFVDVLGAPLGRNAYVVYHPGTGPLDVLNEVCRAAGGRPLPFLVVLVSLCERMLGHPIPPPIRMRLEQKGAKILSRFQRGFTRLYDQEFEVDLLGHHCLQLLHQVERRKWEQKPADELTNGESGTRIANGVNGDPQQTQTSALRSQPPGAPTMPKRVRMTVTTGIGAVSPLQQPLLPRLQVEEEKPPDSPTACGGEI
eukprot:TRINITY_DN13055_c0_g3_i1.p1 TRINITY_DN13055_c0_g3~~TRINITY_DN13055_c0_g3_i1.p1  ORF type:complete len:1688 (+),score=266.12 TRINITY_DN13055_c0_g3_i1:471-5066(+)